MVKYSMSLCVLIFWRVWEGNCILAICPGAKPWESRGKRAKHSSPHRSMCSKSKSRGTVKGKINNSSGKVLSFERLQPKSISWRSRSPSVYLQLDGHFCSCAVLRSSRSQAAGSEHGFLFSSCWTAPRISNTGSSAPSTAHARTHAFLPVSVGLVRSHVCLSGFAPMPGVTRAPHTVTQGSLSFPFCIHFSFLIPVLKTPLEYGQMR